MTIPEFETIATLPESVSKVITRLVACEFFTHGGIIGGSWCFPFYDAAVGIKYSFRTHDLDFMVHGAIQRKNEVISNLEEELEKEGFISTMDYATHLQKFVTAEMEVEFLIPRRGNNEETVLIRAFNITAQPLPFLEILFHEPMALHVKAFGGIVRVPSPRSMLLHKMIIAHRRDKESKREKDLDQCKVLSLYCTRDEIQELANKIGFGKPTWRNIAASCELIGLDPPITKGRG